MSKTAYTLDELQSLILQLDSEGLDTSLLKIVANTIGHPKWSQKQVDVVKVMQEFTCPTGEAFRVPGSDDECERRVPFASSPAAHVFLAAAETIAESKNHPAFGREAEPEVATLPW